MSQIVPRKVNQIAEWVKEVRSLAPSECLRLYQGVDFAYKTKSLREYISRHCKAKRIQIKTKLGTDKKGEFIDLWLLK